MALTTTVDHTAARDALGSVVPRLTGLIRSIRAPQQAALGEWNTAQVARHLAHAWERLPALARGDLPSPLSGIEQLGDFTVAMVRDDPDDVYDVERTASRIEAAAAEYLPLATGGAEPRPWLLQGVTLPASAFTCHLLNESLVHGFDISRAEGRQWTIPPAHAGMCIAGFLVPALSAVDPHTPVDPVHGAGVRACFDIRVRGVTRFFIVLDDGTMAIEPPSSRRVDWHLSAEASTLFLLLWSRISPLPATLRGRLLGWGRRPDLGLRLPRMLRNP